MMKYVSESATSDRAEWN